MIDNSKEYIICAAIWYKTGKEEAPRGFMAQNISTGIVIGQWRHGNCIAVMPTNPKFNGGYDSVQGFLTSKGNFVDRWEGMRLAYEAGQVDEKTALNDKWDGSEYDPNHEPTDFRKDTKTWKYNMMFSEDIY